MLTICRIAAPVLACRATIGLRRLVRLGNQPNGNITGPEVAQKGAGRASARRASLSRALVLLPDGIPNGVGA